MPGKSRSSSASRAARSRCSWAMRATPPICSGSSRPPSSGTVASIFWSTTPIPGAPRAFLEISEDQLYQGYFLPFKAAYVNTQLAARQMIEQGSPGAIITITSVHQDRAWGWDSVYGSMKAALRRLVMSQARELAVHKIRVNAIAPGFIDHRLLAGERRERYHEFNIPPQTQIPPHA